MRCLVAKNESVQIVEREKPKATASSLLIKTIYSVISPGTEISIMKNSMGKEAVIGYSAVGIVEECGESATGFKTGDVVACYGAPYVGHAEYLLVPVTLCAKVPTGVTPEEAAFAGIGAIAIHALRTAELQFGETVCVVGLGLLGQMIAKIADAAAYNVLANDLYKARTDMLHQDTGIRTFTNTAQMEVFLSDTTGGKGADAVLLCAGGKKSPLTGHSLSWIRDRGKVVIVGDIEPDFPRDLMFKKEAQILISRAGGPGRYDPVFEKKSIDYPYGYIRWTEGRNIMEYLRLVYEKRINVEPFLNVVLDFDDAPKAYKNLQNKNTDNLTKIIKY